jgi:hypothetical protein
VKATLTKASRPSKIAEENIPDASRMGVKRKREQASEHHSIDNGKTSGTKRRRKHGEVRSAASIDQSHQTTLLQERPHKAKVVAAAAASSDSSSSSESEAVAPSVVANKVGKNAAQLKDGPSKKAQTGVQSKAVSSSGTSSSSSSEAEKISEKPPPKPATAKVSPLKVRPAEPMAKSSSSGSCSDDESSSGSDEGSKPGNPPRAKLADKPLSGVVASKKQQTSSSSDNSSSSDEDSTPENPRKTNIADKALPGAAVSGKKQQKSSSSDDSSSSSEDSSSSDTPVTTAGKKPVAAAAALTKQPAAATGPAATNEQRKPKRKRKRKNKNKNKLPAHDIAQPAVVPAVAAVVRPEPVGSGRRKVFRDEEEASEERNVVSEQAGDVFTADEIRDLYSLSKPVSVPVATAAARHIGPQLPKVGHRAICS